MTLKSGGRRAPIEPVRYEDSIVLGAPLAAGPTCSRHTRDRRSWAPVERQSAGLLRRRGDCNMSCELYVGYGCEYAIH